MNSNSTDHLDGTVGPALLAFVRDEVTDGAEPVEADTDLLLTGLVDSLGVVMIVEWIEQRLDTTIDPGDVVLENFRNIESMLAYLRDR